MCQCMASKLGQELWCAAYRRGGAHLLISAHCADVGQLLLPHRIHFQVRVTRTLSNNLHRCQKWVPSTASQLTTCSPAQAIVKGLH